jgi:hypothetical protein
VTGPAPADRSRSADRRSTASGAMAGGDRRHGSARTAHRRPGRPDGASAATPSGAAVFPAASVAGASRAAGAPRRVAAEGSP